MAGGRSVSRAAGACMGAEVPYPLCFLFVNRPAVMRRVLGIVYRCIATHLIKKTGFSCKTAQTGAVALIQRFGSVPNLNTPRSHPRNSTENVEKARRATSLAERFPGTVAQVGELG